MNNNQYADKKQQMIQQLSKLSNSWGMVSYLWHEVNLNDLHAVEKYPFELSFDDYNIDEWVIDTVHELKGPQPKMSTYIENIEKFAKHVDNSVQKMMDQPNNPFVQDMTLSMNGESITLPMNADTYIRLQALFEEEIREYKELMKPVARPGIWTPTARVICFECHGPVFPRKTYRVGADEWLAVTTPKRLEEDNDITKCDTCECDIQLEEGIAQEHNLVLKLREVGIDAHMEQTGGMCSAACIEKKDGGYYYVTAGVDSDYQFVMGEYDNEGEWMEDSANERQFEELENMFIYIKSLDNVKELETNE